MSDANPNPIDPIAYTLIDNFNRTGNINANPTPTRGADWNSLSSSLLLTNAAGYLEFPVGSTYIPGSPDFAMIKSSNGSTKKVSFDISYPTAGKVLFFGLRSNELNTRVALTGGETVEVRLRDIGADFMVTIQSVTDNTVSVILAEVRIGDALGANNKTPVTITDDGKRITVQALGGEVFVDTTLYSGNGSIIFGTNADSLIQVSKMRIW